MASIDRDNFRPNTKNILAMRAGFRCSMPGCGALTVGPSDESNSAVVKVGIAAHIHAASPDGPRYDHKMTEEERRDIRNGIWLCGTHSIEIDRDTVRYSPEVLMQMKDEHERAIANELNAGHGCFSGSDLVAIGPNIVGIGELLGTNGKVWSIRIDHFVEGSVRAIIDFCERFDAHNPFNRYLIVNALGDGRQLASCPSWHRTGSSIELNCKIEDSFPRDDVRELGQTFATNDANDLFVNKESFTIVSGINSLPQRIKQSLSMFMGESPFHPLAGSRIKEYLDEFENSPWLQQWIKLDVIRLACVPYKDSVSNLVYTLLPCVLHVDAIEMIEPVRNEDWLNIRFKLDVQGVGPWEQVIPIFAPRGNIPAQPHFRPLVD